MELWEQQKGERSKAFMLFCIYRDLGPLRSLDKCADKFRESGENTISIRQVQEYSLKNDWVNRAKAYDMHCDEIARLEREEAIKEMEHRHAKDTAKIQQATMDLFNHPDMKNVESLEASKVAWILMTLANTYEKAGGFERLTLGETTEYVANKVDSELNVKLDADISVFDKVKKAKKLIEDEE